MPDTALLKTLSSPRRQEILRLVWTEELCAGDIRDAMPDVTFGAVSMQLKVLADAGLVETRAEGRHRYFRACKAALGPVAKVLESMWDDALWRLKLAAELEQSRRGPKSKTRVRTRAAKNSSKKSSPENPRTAKRRSSRS